MNNIVFIADILEDNYPINITNNNLERLNETYYNDVYTALCKVSPSVTHYSSPKQFIDNISLHKNDIVLSLWSGTGSINRKVLIPSICEAYGIRYIGADAYVQYTCQDKALSKYVCRKYNINSAKGVLIKHAVELENIKKLELPIVIKPNYEGGSIGISKDSIAFSYDDAKEKILLLLKSFDQAILVEEYLMGHEICVTLSGTRKKLDIIEADEIIIDDPDTKYTMFGFEAKKAEKVRRRRIPATDLLSHTQKNEFSQLFFDLGKVDVMRIDGKIQDGYFKLIELSPDTNLSRSASTAYAFQLAGYSYEDMFRLLLSYQRD